MKDNRRTSSTAHSFRKRAEEFFLMDTIENVLRTKPTDIIVGGFVAILLTILIFILAIFWGNYTVAMLVIFIWIMSL